MYYCHDCKHWCTVWAFRSDGQDRECGLCSMIFDDLPVETFFNCEDLANFINNNYLLIDYSCGAETECDGYEERDNG